MTSRTILGILVVLMMALTACGSNTAAEPPVAAAEAGGNTTALDAEPPTEPTEASSITPTEPSSEPAAEPVAGASVEPTAEPPTELPAEASGTATTLNEDYPDSVPVFMQLAVGAMMLEETGNGVTAEQAQELLPLWLMFRAVRRGDAPPSLEEINAITDQIIQAMTPEQLGTIREMQITQDGVRTFTLDNSIPQGSGQGSGGGQMGMSGGDTQDLSPEERRMRMITGGGKNLVDELIRRLEIWTGG